MKRFLLSLLVVFLLLSSVAFGAETPKYGGTLIFGRGGDSVALDPANVTDGESTRVTEMIFEGLVGFKGETTDVIPVLATSWTISKDGKVWTFKLRKGVKFHDGTPFNAEAVKFSFDRQFDKNHPYYKYGRWEYAEFALDPLQKVEIVDDYTVRFTLKYPFSPFLANLAMFSCAIVSPTAVKKYEADFFKNPVGTGPFKFVEWTQKDKIVLEANSDYWGGRPYLDKLIFRVIPDNSVRWLELQKGSIDAMDGINPDDIPAIKNDPNVVFYQVPALNICYLAMNTEKKPFDNVSVRRAINYAINKKAIVDAFYGGIGIVAKNPIPPNMMGYNDKVKDYEYNPEKAKELLAKAGYPNGFETTLWTPSIPRVYVPQPTKVAEAIQADLAKVGIKAKIVTYDWGTYLQKTREGEHDMAILGWGSDNGDPDNTIYVLLDKDNTKKGVASNISFYKNDRLHDILIKAQQATSVSARKRLYEAAQEIIKSDAPWVPLAHTSAVAATRKYVKNFAVPAIGAIKFTRVWLDK
ncbi:MAG TPA: ABC transporter substrate-binding protein [bacterium]|nr:ABC transporter substrate-binding protein [bacterium]